MAAPLVVARFPDGAWLAVARLEPHTGGTIAADCEQQNGGDTLVDARLRFASLGGVASGQGLDLGAWYPGTEGEFTYSSGGLPLSQPRAWRRRFHPVRDGLRQDYHLVWRAGRSADSDPDLWRASWGWAWELFAPHARVEDLASRSLEMLDVLADQVTTQDGRTGVPLEADAVRDERTDEDSSAVMGFVGANTDAAHILLRTAQQTQHAARRDRYRALGTQIMDTFAALPLDPPAAEGFDTATGALTTYREFDGQPAVYARSVAEGCHAALDAHHIERGAGCDHPNWLRWAVSGADWLLSQQRPDGSIPRAWVAGTGAVLDDSPNASAVLVPFLVAVGTRTGHEQFVSAATLAAEWSWHTFGKDGSWAGATLDNPDVVDKEAAVLAAEGYLDLHDATRGNRWLARAETAASVAETWTYLWDVPMPRDADDSRLHWKRGVPTTGHQLITTGASMTDGFLAVNAAMFARLWAATGDDHWLDVARLITHGSTAMLAAPDRPFDLRGPGWQQEHWCFGGRRGYGLNRRWLPWVPVAHVRGMYRLLDLGPRIAQAVLG